MKRLHCTCESGYSQDHCLTCGAPRIERSDRWKLIDTWGLPVLALLGALLILWILHGFAPLSDFRP